jgi:hypothetical protein
MNKEEIKMMKKFLNKTAPVDVNVEQVLALMLFCGEIIDAYEKMESVLMRSK